MCIIAKARCLQKFLYTILFQCLTGKNITAPYKISLRLIPSSCNLNILSINPEPFYTHLVRGKSACLVSAYNIYRAECFHSRKFFHNGIFPRHPLDTHCKGEAYCRKQTLRHICNNDAYGEYKTLQICKPCYLKTEQEKQHTEAYCNPCDHPS